MTPSCNAQPFLLKVYYKATVIHFSGSLLAFKLSLNQDKRKFSENRNRLLHNTDLLPPPRKPV